MVLFIRTYSTRPSSTAPAVAVRSHDLCVTAWVAGREIPGERSAGVPRRSLDNFAKNFKWLLVVCCWPTLEFQDRNSSSSFVVEAEVVCRLLSKPTLEVACRLLLKPMLGLQKVRDLDSAVLALLLYICIRHA